MKKRKADDRKIAWLAAEHQANLMLLAASWSANVRDAIDSTEYELLGALPELLDDFGTPSYTAAAQKRYLELRRRILMLRAKSFSSTLEYLSKQGAALVDNEIKWANALSKQMDAAAGGATTLPTAKITQMVKYATVDDGATIDESLAAAAQDDAQRIAASCREGMRQGKTIAEIAADIRGTKSADYTDGILNATKAEAERIARTACCGIADEAKMQFYLANADVIRGVRHVATLSGNTCLVCGNYDGMVWDIPQDVAAIPRLPIHPNCRCVHLPVTEMDDINRSTRPAEAANFWKEAEEAYNRDNPGKNWNDLARSTRLKYYYQAQKDYEKRTGKPAFDQVPQNMSFEAWLATKDDKYLRQYLGKTRFALYKKGKLPLRKFVNPETNRAFTIAELKKRDKASFRKAGLTDEDEV